MIIAIETASTDGSVALARPDGSLLAVDGWSQIGGRAASCCRTCWRSSPRTATGSVRRPASRSASVLARSPACGWG